MGTFIYKWDTSFINERPHLYKWDPSFINEDIYISFGTNGTPYYTSCLDPECGHLIVSQMQAHINYSSCLCNG